MPKRTLRQAVIVHGTDLVSVIVIPPGKKGDETLANYNGKARVADVSDEYGETFLDLTGCVAVEITKMNPMPGVGIGWSYIDGTFVGPVIDDTPPEEP